MMAERTRKSAAPEFEMPGFAQDSDVAAFPSVYKADGAGSYNHYSSLWAQSNAASHQTMCDLGVKAAYRKSRRA